MIGIAKEELVKAGQTSSLFRSDIEWHGTTIRWQCSYQNKQPITTQQFGRVHLSTGIGGLETSGELRHDWTCDADAGVLAVDGGCVSAAATAPDNADMRIRVSASCSDNGRTNCRYTQRITAEGVIVFIEASWAQYLSIWGNGISAPGTDTQVRLYAANTGPSADFVTHSFYPYERIVVPGGIDRIWVQSTTASIVHAVWQLIG